MTMHTILWVQGELSVVATPLRAVGVAEDSADQAPRLVAIPSVHERFVIAFDVVPARAMAKYVNIDVLT